MLEKFRKRMAEVPDAKKEEPAGEEFGGESLNESASELTASGSETDNLVEELPPVKPREDDETLGKKLKIKMSQSTHGTIILIGIILILASKIVYDFEGFGNFLSAAGKLVISILSYLLVGFVIAYVLSTFAGWLQRKPLKKVKSVKARKIISIVLAYITLFAVVAFIATAIISKVVDSAGSLAKMVPNLAEKAYALYTDIIEDGRFNLPEVVKEGIVKGIDGAKNMLLNLLSADFITGHVTKIVTATGSGIVMVVMGLLVSVYMMIEKDNAAVAAKRIVYGLFSPKRANSIVEGGRKVNLIFRQYFAGKLLQALIVMVMAYVFMLIGRVEYAILFAVIIGFTNMIPYVGPWIGGIPTILISLVADPWMGLRALICVLAIQAVDNWVVSPRIVGHKMGVSPLLVLAGLCIGGKLFGFVGMVFGDVLAAIVKVFFYDTFIAHRLHKKVKDGELPAEYSLDKADLEAARVLAEAEAESGGEGPANEAAEEVRGFKAFWKKLFKKKDKKE